MLVWIGVSSYTAAYVLKWLIWLGLWSTTMFCPSKTFSIRKILYKIFDILAENGLVYDVFDSIKFYLLFSSVTIFIQQHITC